ncbi:MAG TPA: CGNR zinc finger domain-containing protein [Candidatus Dormibacteraeota bacterium]|nr:CGNR zinc finger domain-containing protein [Candidatus Dormibacteraeota bacterium]
MPALFGSPPPSAIPHDWGVSPCLDLINSHWSDHLGSGASYDRLPVARFRRAFLGRWHLDAGDLDDPQLQSELAHLRALLRNVLEGYASGRPMTESTKRRLEAEMNRAPLALNASLQHRRSGGRRDAVLAEIATSAAQLIAERRTVKVCANPNCSWMFVDESRPGTRRWCNTGVCGSLINVRRYRHAHRD